MANAIENFKKSLELYPLETAYYNLVEIYITKNDYKSAKNILEEGIKKIPDYPKFYFLLGYTYKLEKDYQNAYKYFIKNLEFETNNDETYNQLGEIYLTEGNYDEAINNFEKALKINYKNSEAHINLGITYYKKGDFKKAADEFENTKKLDPQYDSAYFNAGLVYYKLNEYEKSKDNFIEAIKLNPEVSSFYFYLSRTLYYIPGKLDEAELNIEKALNMKELPLYYYGAGKIYEKKMEKVVLTEKDKYLNKAIESYQKVINLAPETQLAKWAYERLLALTPNVRLVNNFKLSTYSSSSPAIYENILTAGDNNGLLFLFDLKSQTNILKNKIILDSALISDLLVDNKFIFAGTLNGFLYIIDIDGNVLSKIRLSSSISGLPCYFNNRLFCGTKNGDIYAISLNDFKIIWNKNIGNSVVCKIFVENNKLFTASKDGKIFAFSISDGNILWSKNLNGEIKEAFCLKSPYIACGTTRGILYLLNIENGEILQSLKLDKEIYSLVIDQQNIIYASAGSILYSIDSKNNILWKFNADSNINTKLKIVDDYILFGTLLGSAYSVKIKDGTENWHYRWNYSLFGEPINIAQNSSLIASSDGSILQLFYRKTEKKETKISEEPKKQESKKSKKKK